MNAVMQQLLGGAPDPAPIEIMFDVAPVVNGPVRRSTYDDLKDDYDRLKQDHDVLVAAFEDQHAKCMLLMKDALAHNGAVKALEEQVEELQAVASADERQVALQGELNRLRRTIETQRNVIMRLQAEAADARSWATEAEHARNVVYRIASERRPVRSLPTGQRPLNRIRDFLGI